MADAARHWRAPHPGIGAQGLGAPIRVVIGERDTTSPARIANFLADQPDLDIVAECLRGEEVVSAIEARRPELVFLDVHLPGMNAFDVVAAVGAARMPAVVFIATRDDLAARAFEVHAFDYLIRPLRRRRVEEALARAREHVARERLLALASRLLRQSPPEEEQERRPERLLVRCASRLVFVEPDEIDWIEADGNYVRLHAGTKSYRVRKTISEMETGLGGQFARVHRRILVRVARVRELRLRPGGRCDAVLDGGARLSVGRTYRASLQKRLEGG